VSIDSALQAIWYERGTAHRIVACFLWPLSLVFATVASLRRGLYKIGVFKSLRVTRPVIVVGNITVGGTGKTPFVIWLTQQLRERGLHPAIITRGYGGRATQWPQVVTEDSDPLEVGDEAVLLAQRTQAVVVAGPNRVADAQRAIELGADVIVCDDGLQHYRLQRDAELVLFDAARGVGNGLYLPAGPLREGMHRLGAVSLVVLHRRGSHESQPIQISGAAEVSSELGAVHSLIKAEQRTLTSFAGQSVHAVAGIGNPSAFFASLRAEGLVVDGRALSDHAPISASDLMFNDELPVLMTEKDAVKCRAFADSRCWSVELKLHVLPEHAQRIVNVCEAAIRSRSAPIRA
jgi:tetraacyldisaccharide 4'-kinase